MNKHIGWKRINDQRTFFLSIILYHDWKINSSNWTRINGMTPFICHNFDIVCHMLNEWRKTKLRQKINTVREYLDDPSYEWFSFPNFLFCHWLIAEHDAYLQKICWPLFILKTSNAAVGATTIAATRNLRCKTPNMTSVCKQIFIVGTIKRDKIVWTCHRAVNRTIKWKIAYRIDCTIHPKGKQELTRKCAWTFMQLQ